MKYYLFSLLLFFPFTYSFSQSIQKGLWYQKEEQYNHAVNNFNEIIRNNPSLDTALFYLGDTYFKMRKYDSAEICYKKIGAIDPDNPFYQAGLGKTFLLKKDMVQANAAFDKVRKVARRDVSLFISIIQACLSPDVKDTVTARLYIEYANKVNSSSPQYFIKNAVPFFISLGDLYYAEENLGKAANAYESAIYYDKANSEAYVKLGSLYSSAGNFNGAYDSYNKAIEIEPELILVYKLLGDLCYIYGQYSDAEKSYNTYMTRGEISLDDRERFALILFFSKKYSKADSVMKEVIKVRADDPVLYRIGGYIAYETGDYKKGLDYMKQFFKIQDPKKLLTSDYEYLGKLYIKNGQDSMGIINLVKTVELDSTKVFYYEEIAKIYVGKEDHPQAIKYYRLVHTNTPQERLNISFSLGKEYFYSGNELKLIYDSLAAKLDELKLPKDEIAGMRQEYESYFSQADSCFEKVSELSSKSYLGYLWRARSLSLLDPDALTDSAKIMYEKVLSIIQAGDMSRNKREVIECYRYFGSYYFYKSDREIKSDPPASKADKNTSKTFFEKILELDPEDAQAKTVLQVLNQKQ